MSDRAPALLEQAGIVLLVIAAGLVAVPLGLAVAGIGLLYLAFLMERRP